MLNEKGECLIKPQVRIEESNRFALVAKNLGIGFIASLVTGIITGLLLRLIMKIIAIFYPEFASGFTFGGTFMLVVLGIGFSMASSIIYVFIHRYLPKGWGWNGLIYGFINLVILGIPLFLSNPNNELFGPQAQLGITLFSLLFLAGGILLAMFVRSVTNWVDHSQSRVKYTYIAFGLLIIPAVAMAGGIVYEMIYELIPAIRLNW
nr:hypothetical protein [Neobacillus sp. Marseille-Q6967]